MKLWLYMAASLVVASPVVAQDEDGLVEARLIGDPTPTSVSVLRPQLTHHDHRTPRIIGAVSAVVGGVALIGSWTLYISAQSYRLRPWTRLDDGTVDNWVTMRAASLWMGVGASALLTASEYLLLPEAQDPPLLAWIGGAVGVGVAAVGLGFAVAGTHCPPQVIRPGADLLLACDAGTSDSVFGPLLLVSSIPLLNLPLTYLLRSAFRGEPDSLSIGPRGLQMKVRF
jgi:hypothetical protein